MRKEMYEFADRGGRALALRPEGTASVVRAFVQHRPPVPWKAWYVTPAFRYERPQAGRYRQHHQLGVEVLGTEDPDVDVEVIALAAGFFRWLGPAPGRPALNSMGCDACRPAYLELLRDVPRRARATSCATSTAERFGANPLRVLDCKRAGVPGRDRRRARAHRLPRARPVPAHFARVRGGPRRARRRLPARPRLVRGLDYYTRTTFEFVGRRARRRRRTRRRRRALRRAGRGARGARRPRASASASASSGCCWPATPRACFPVDPAALDAFVVDVDRRGPRPGT